MDRVRLRMKRAFSTFAKPPLLQSENVSDFDDLLKELGSEIKPRGFIEQMYVHDMSCIIWETMRLQRSKAAIINMAFYPALLTVIDNFVEPDDDELDEDGDARYTWRIDYANQVLADKSTRENFSTVLRDCKLDESVIEAEAIRQSFDDLEVLDNMLMRLEARRDKTLRRIVEYREDFAIRLRASADKMIDGGRHDLSQLKNSSGNRSAA